MMNPEVVSRVSRVAYGVVALINVAVFMFRHDANYLMIALLLVVLISNQRTLDLWREAAQLWRDSAENWQQSATLWRKLAESWRSEKWN